MSGAGFIEGAQVLTLKKMPSGAIAAVIGTGRREYPNADSLLADLAPWLFEGGSYTPRDAALVDEVLGYLEDKLVTTALEYRVLHVDRVTTLYRLLKQYRDARCIVEIGEVTEP